MQSEFKWSKRRQPLVQSFECVGWCNGRSYISMSWKIRQNLHLKRPTVNIQIPKQVSISDKYPCLVSRHLIFLRPFKWNMCPIPFGLVRLHSDYSMGMTFNGIQTPETPFNQMRSYLIEWAIDRVWFYSTNFCLKTKLPSVWILALLRFRMLGIQRFTVIIFNQNLLKRPCVVWMSLCWK